MGSLGSAARAFVPCAPNFDAPTHSARTLHVYKNNIFARLLTTKAHGNQSLPITELRRAASDEVVVTLEIIRV